MPSGPSAARPPAPRLSTTSEGPSAAHARAIPSASAPSASDAELVFAADQDVASLEQRADQLRRAVGPPQTRAQVRVDHPDPACAVEQRDRCALRAGSEHRGDPGDEDRARVFDRHITQVGRVEPARRGAGTQVGETTGAVAEHQAGRTSGIGRDPSQIDALALERVADPRAGVVGAEPADPGHAEAGARERDAGVGLGAAVRGVEGPARSPGSRRQRSATASSRRARARRTVRSSSHQAHHSGRAVRDRVEVGRG